MKRIFYSLIAATALTGFSSQAFADGHASCGTVTMADMSWPSASLMANVDAFIMENGYGCEVELVSGATVTTFTSMEAKGEPMVAPELWANAVREPLYAAIEEGRLVSAIEGPMTELGEGWWIPSYIAEANPELKTVLDVIERPDLFPATEDPSKGEFIGCPAGWGCQLSNINLFRAFEMEEKGWILTDPGTQAGLDASLVKANERKEPWFGYYWSPTVLIGKYGMKFVPFGVDFAGSDNWDGCIVKPEQDCANPQPSSWTKSEVHTVVTDKFKEQAGDALNYLQKRIYPGAVMNGMLVYMDTEQAQGPDAAMEFLIKHEDVWTTWVPADVAEKVKSAM